MFHYLVIFCLCNVVIAAVIPGDKDATILNYDYKNDGRGNYEFSYYTSNGISRTEFGRLVNAGQDNEHIAVEGFYSYIDSDGNTQAFQYTADENGYHIELQVAVAPHVASLLGR